MADTWCGWHLGRSHSHTARSSWSIWQDMPISMWDGTFTSTASTCSYAGTSSCNDNEKGEAFKCHQPDDRRWGGDLEWGNHHSCLQGLPWQGRRIPTWGWRAVAGTTDKPAQPVPIWKDAVCGHGDLGALSTQDPTEDQDERGQVQCSWRDHADWAVWATWLRILERMLHGLQDWCHHVRRDHPLEVGPLWEDDSPLQREVRQGVLGHHLPGWCQSSARACGESSQKGPGSLWEGTTRWAGASLRSYEALGLGVGPTGHGSAGFLAQRSHRTLHALLGQEHEHPEPGWERRTNPQEGNCHHLNEEHAISAF